MHNKIITVYLDSNDYSVLSDPRKSTDSLTTIRSELVALAESKKVRFAFSGAHLSEMAPLHAKYNQAATARADFLIQLCGKNAFISFDRLIALEISRLANLDQTPVNALTEDANWYPELGNIASPLDWAELAMEIDKGVKDRGLNREQRRALQRQLFKANQPTNKMQGWLNHQGKNPDVSDILNLYPMRPEDAKVISRYALGQTTAEAAQEAFLNSLRDPRWMMRWFADHHKKLTPVTKWLRGPSEEMATRLEKIASNIKELRQYEQDNGAAFKVDMLTRPGWMRQQNNILTNLSKSLIDKLDNGITATEFGPEEVDLYCPGLSTAVRTLHSSFWNSVGDNPRLPEKSDFVDAVHSMYAPYVNIFRADRYMAPHIRNEVSKRGVSVVNRLEDVLEEIKTLI